MEKIEEQTPNISKEKYYREENDGNAKRRFSVILYKVINYIPER